MLKFRIHGINKTLRSLANTSDVTYNAARKGTTLSAEHLKRCIVEKFGKKNPTGGDPKGYGAWKSLKFETRVRKIRKYGHDRGPLIASGKAKDSFIIIEGGVNRLAASVGTDCDYLIHHIYGAPGANVPMRDPIRVTQEEESEHCRDIIENEIKNALSKAGW